MNHLEKGILVSVIRQFTGPCRTRYTQKSAAYNKSICEKIENESKFVSDVKTAKKRKDKRDNNLIEILPWVR